MLHHRDGRVSEYALEMLGRIIAHHSFTGGTPYQMYARFAKLTATPALDELVSAGLIDIVFQQDGKSFAAEAYWKRLMCWMMGNPDVIRMYQINLKGAQYFIDHCSLHDRINPLVLEHAKEWVYLESKKVKEL